MTTPEQRAREVIDAKLAECGWVVQSRDEINLAAEIIEDLQAALEELQAISDNLAQTPGAREGERNA